MRFTAVLPYTSIWMKKQKESFTTTLEVTMTAKDPAEPRPGRSRRRSPRDPVTRLKETARTAFTADAVASLPRGTIP